MSNEAPAPIAAQTGPTQDLEQPDTVVPTVTASKQAQKPRAQWIYDAAAAGQKYHFRTKTPLRHNAINAVSLLTILGSIAGTISVANAVTPWLYVPIAAAMFGLLYFGLFILVVHEASHGMLWLSADKARTKRWNARSGWFIATIFGVHYEKHWEVGHLEHHVRPLEPSDPQRFSIPIQRDLWSKVLKILLIPGFLFYDRTVGRAQTKSGKSSSSKPTIIAFVVTWVGILTAASLLSGAPLALAMLGGIHVLGIWNLVKGGLEHGGAIGKEADTFFRSRTTMFLGRRILMPFNITLHFEHHLNFTVPWYDLVRYQADLQSIVPEVVLAEVVNSRPLAQLSGALGGLSPQARQATLPAQP